MRLAVLGTIFLLLSFSLASGQVSQRAVNQKKRPSTAVTRQAISIEQINEPLQLKYSSATDASDNARVVELRFGIKINTERVVRSYRVHFEQEFEDKQFGRTPVVITSDMFVPHSPVKQKEVRFRARKEAKVKVWVSNVEFEDGTTWKAEATSAEKSGVK